MASAPTPAIMEEVFAADLVIGEEYYYHATHKYPPNDIGGTFQTKTKAVVRFNKFIRNNKIGDFTIVKPIYGEEKTNANIWIHFDLPRLPSKYLNYMYKLYRKIDTPKKQEIRDQFQQREALAKMYSTGYSYYENDGTLVTKPGLHIHQYYGNDGQPQFSRPPDATPDGQSYLLGGKRKSRRTRKSKKSRKIKSRKIKSKNNTYSIK